MVPNRVFLEEIKHLLPVSELSQPLLPKLAIVRKTNVVHYKRNRYEVPKGTYRPGKQVLIEICDNTIMFIENETGNLLSKHEISDGVGKLIQLPRNHERFKKEKPGRREELELAVSEGFSECNGGGLFVDEIIAKYPRYVCDQLRIIRKAQEKYSKPELERALVYCIERDLFSANDFRDTLEYFGENQPLNTPHEVKLDVKYSMVTAQIRDLSAYTSLESGGGIYAQ